MRNLPIAIIQVLRPFERVFSERVWEWAKHLIGHPAFWSVSKVKRFLVTPQARRSFR